MATKTLRVFAEYTTGGFVPMPVGGNIDYGFTVANTFPSTTPSSYQTDNPDLVVTVTASTDFYVWIRINGSDWNPSFTRNVRVYPDSPDINNVVMNMIIATGPAGVAAYTQLVQTANRLYFNGATTDSVYNSKFAGKTYINELTFGTIPQLATVATSGAYADLTGKPTLAPVATSGLFTDLSSKPSGLAPLSYNSGLNRFEITQASTSVNGFLSSTDWTTFNSKQGALSLTVNGSSGASTLIANVLNIPTYTLAGLGGITASFLSGGAGISYNSGTGVIAYTGNIYTDASIRGLFSASTGLSYNSSTGAFTNTITQYTDALARGAISLTTTGTSGSSAYNSTTGVLNIPTITLSGLGGQASITLTVSGSSGASTFVSNTLNIPTYTLAGLGGQAALSGTGFVKISGTTISYDNSTYYLASNPSGYTTNVGTVTSVSGTGTVSGLTLTGSITTSGSLTLGGTLSLTSLNVTTALGYTPYNSTNPSGYITSAGTASAISTTITGTSVADLVYAAIADNDFFRIRVGGTATNAGYVEIATADDGTEPIYVRQYTGVFSSLIRTATLLDGSGNTSFPGTLSASNYSGTHTGTSSGTNTGDQTNISGNAATVSSITSGQVTTALGYTPYNATNPNGYTTNVGTVTSVAAITLGTSGTDLSSSITTGTTTPVITLNVPTASATNRGALSAADWSTFNGKQDFITAGTTAQYYRGDKTFQTLNTSVVAEGTNLYYTEARVNANANVAANTAARHNAVTLGTANGLSLSTQALSLGLASGSTTGALSSTDWTTFNNKQGALTLGTLSEANSNVISFLDSGVGKIIGDLRIQIIQSSASSNGYLSSGNWTTFNNKESALTFSTGLSRTGNTITNTITNNNQLTNGSNYITSSSLSGYLPLTGGTLTGALSGTSATFKTDQNAYTWSRIDNQANNASAYAGLQFGAYGNSWGIAIGSSLANSNSLNFVIDAGGTNVPKFTISSTGAATFSSSVGVGGVVATDYGIYRQLAVYGGATGGGMVIASSGSATGVLAFANGTSGTSQYKGYIEYQHANDVMAFGTNATERMRITSAGNVGIGTTSPSTALEVSSSDLNNIFVTNPTTTGATTGSGIGFKAYNGTSVAQYGGIFLTSNTWSFGTYLAQQLSIGADGTGGLALRSANSAPINFYTGGASAGVSTERMRITSGGNILLGTTTDNGERLYVSGAIRATGNITANSDLTLKKNLSLIENPIKKLNALNGYLYQWKENDEYQYGVIAQEVEKVLPYAVQTGSNGIKGVAYNQLAPLLIEGFKQHDSEINKLKARIKYLESKIA